MKAAVEHEARAPKSRKKGRVVQRRSQPGEAELRELERALEEANAELERATKRLEELRKKRRRR